MKSGIFGECRISFKCDLVKLIELIWSMELRCPNNHAYFNVRAERVYSAKAENTKVLADNT